MLFTDDEDDEILGLDDEKSNDEPAEEEYKYEVLNANQIVENMISSIREVESVVQFNPTITRLLLNHCSWDRERLYERIFDCREQIFKDAKIVYLGDNEMMTHKDMSDFRETISNPTIQARGQSNNISKDSTNDSHDNKQCQICCLEVSHLAGLGCGHLYCKDCWINYLTTKIMDDGQPGKISCAAHNCEAIMDDQLVLPLLQDPKVRLRYQQLITNSYVECNQNLRWCPKPGCGHAIKVVYPEFQPVKCVCGTQFCFLCGDNWHEPVKCYILKKWKKKCDDDSETSHWIAANTKECPKCHVTIEKNGGCNHMVCKNFDCKTEFCWVCLGNWSQHGSSWYSCNRYDETDAKAARDAQERHRALLQRYLFYCKRYMNHMNSLRFENKLYIGVRDKMLEMQQHNMSWIEVQFLTRAVDVLCHCRQTLMYTYVFAYYLGKNNQSIIFEANQRDLESATETLSEYLERDITSDNIRDIKAKVQDKYRYCASRRQILLEHVQEGYEQDWWRLEEF